MKRARSMGVALVVLGLGCPANSADIPVKAPSATLPAVYNWAGFYVGVAAGGTWGSYDPGTSTVGDAYMSAASAAAVNAAGIQSIKPTGFATGIEGGYNWQVGNLLLGVEADLQAVHLNGATNSGAVPYPGAPAGRSFTITSYGNTNWVFTARPRVGIVAPNHWLFYVTGGLALTRMQSDFSFIDNGVPTSEESGKLDTVKMGYTVGGGVEAPLTDRLSLKAEYLHVDFANTAGAVTANNLPAGQGFTHSSDLKADIVRAGLNYRFGGPDAPPVSNPILPLKAPVWKVHPPVKTDWEFEAGARLWFSSGSVGPAQPLLGFPPPPSTLVSRLIYSGLDAVSGETFARVNHASGFFVKGYLGAGGINRGQLNDEDFPGGTPAYSNTLLSASGHIGYATIDLGYNFLTAPGAKAGAFAGYNYYAQAINTYGCTQIAGSNFCVPASPSPLLVITQNNNFNSLRVGLSSEVMVSDRLKLTADAAYLPWVNYAGLDDHLLRQLLLPQASSGGNGVMLEAMLDYKITNAWSVGVGGRYWAWNMNTGSETFNELTAPPPTTQLARYTSERYGMFVQSSYKWGGTTRLAEAPVLAAAPMNWTGFYVGGSVGGGWSNDHWSDPFGSAPSGLGGIDIAGLGDTTHATGPLGGGQIGANWQTGPWVLGVQADAGAADMHGENTCFSGLGGINCQHTVNSLGSITGRIGYAWGRSLAYVKGGGAWTDSTYDLLGNTSALTLGTGSTSLTAWGWTLGGGLEYALTNHWTALAEYDHIGMGSVTVPFPTVATVNTQNISVRQTVDLFKLGVNYKFDWAAPIVANN